MDHRLLTQLKLSSFFADLRTVKGIFTSSCKEKDAQRGKWRTLEINHFIPLTNETRRLGKCMIAFLFRSTVFRRNYQLDNYLSSGCQQCYHSLPSAFCFVAVHQFILRRKRCSGMLKQLLPQKISPHRNHPHSERRAPFVEDNVIILFNSHSVCEPKAYAFKSLGPNTLLV